MKEALPNNKRVESTRPKNGNTVQAKPLNSDGVKKVEKKTK